MTPSTDNEFATKKYVDDNAGSGGSGGGGGGGGSLTIQDEGTSLTTDATTLNFTGPDIKVSGTGNTKTITVDLDDSVVTKKIIGSNISTAPEEISYAVNVSSNKFTLNSVSYPTLNLYKGSTYTFSQTNSSNSSDKLFVSTKPDGRIVLNGGTSIKFPRQALTGTTSQNCVVTSSTNLSGWEGWKAFNHVIGNEGWHTNGGVYSNGVALTGSNSSFNGIYGQWVKIHFQTESFVLKEIKVYQRNNSGHTNFSGRCIDEGYVFGSMDDTSWNQLTNFTGIANSGGYNGYQQGVGKIIDVAAEQSYSYYVILTSKTSWTGGGGGDTPFN